MSDPYSPIVLDSETIKNIIPRQTLHMMWRESGVWMLVWLIGAALISPTLLGMTFYPSPVVLLGYAMLFEAVLVVSARYSEHGSSAIEDIDYKFMFLNKLGRMVIYCAITALFSLFVAEFDAHDKLNEMYQEHGLLVWLSIAITEIQLGATFTACFVSERFGEFLKYYHSHPKETKLGRDGYTMNRRFLLGNAVMSGVVYVVSTILIKTQPHLGPFIAVAVVVIQTYFMVSLYVAFKHIFEGGGGLYQEERKLAEAGA